MQNIVSRDTTIYIIQIGKDLESVPSKYLSTCLLKGLEETLLLCIS